MYLPQQGEIFKVKITNRKGDISIEGYDGELFVCKDSSRWGDGHWKVFANLVIEADGEPTFEFRDTKPKWERYLFVKATG